MPKLSPDRIDEVAMEIMKSMSELHIDMKTAAAAISQIFIFTMARLDPAPGIDFNEACAEMSKHLVEAIIEAREIVLKERDAMADLKAMLSPDKPSSSTTVH